MRASLLERSAVKLVRSAMRLLTVDQARDGQKHHSTTLATVQKALRVINKQRSLQFTF
jgi:hypothetical protein